MTDEEAERRIGIFGPNKLEVDEQNAFLQFLGVSLMFSTRFINSYSVVVHVESLVYVFR